MKKQKKEEILNEFNIYDVIEEYAVDNSIFREDSEEFHFLKKIINEELTETERRIILTYAEIGDLRNTAKIFKVSTSTIRNEIVKIRTKIINLLKII